MNKKLYNLMDWAAIEEIVYGEAMHPEEILGAHVHGKSTVVQAYFPGAKKITLKLNEKKTVNLKEVTEIKMEEADEAGFFAALVPGTLKKEYSYLVDYDDKKKASLHKEVYCGNHVLSSEDADKIMSGSDYKSYKKLGAHVMTINKVSGCGFAVVAPNALRVSVVGDFNNWNGLCHQMMKIDGTDIFELFIPDLSEGENYKFEILVRGAEKLTKCDPYALKVDGANTYNSIVCMNHDFTWQDGDWLFERETFKFDKSPVNIYELDLGSMLRSLNVDSVKKATKDILSYVKKMNYTHIELMPIMEYYDENCSGFYACNYFAPTYRYGSTDDYKHFINEAHKAGIGVIMQFNAASFDNSEMSFAGFDGTCLFEYSDANKGVDTRNGMHIFDYSKDIVRQYLISSLLFWMDEYHVDGFKFNDVTSMLYLDYYRNDGQWTPNIYGGNENLEACAFLRKANKAIHDKKSGVITIADERSSFDNVTFTKGMSETDIENCLGFDITINEGYNTDVLEYMRVDPINRSSRHDAVTLGSLYQFREKYMYSISHCDTDYGKGGLISKMYGKAYDQFASLRSYIGYMMVNPGKKQMFMGQDKADYRAFGAAYQLENDLSEDADRINFNNYIKDLNKFYKSETALYEMDYSEKGFEWINNMAANENIISFVRHGKGADDLLICILNFANTSYEKYKIGVPKKGKYVEAFNSDKEEYGGSGLCNMRDMLSRKDKCDERDESIRVKLAPLSLTIFRYKPLTEKELAEISKREAARDVKKNKRDEEKAIVLKEREDKRKALIRQRAKIKNSLKNDLEKKILEAEKDMSVK